MLYLRIFLLLISLSLCPSSLLFGAWRSNPGSWTCWALELYPQSSAWVLLEWDEFCVSTCVMNWQTSHVLSRSSQDLPWASHCAGDWAPNEEVLYSDLVDPGIPHRQDPQSLSCILCLLYVVLRSELGVFWSVLLASYILSTLIPQTGGWVKRGHLFLRKTWVLVSAPTSVCNSKSRGPDAFFWPRQALHWTWCTCMQKVK